MVHTLQKGSEIQLLLSYVRLSLDSACGSVQDVQHGHEDGDWRALCAIAEQHGVLPLLRKGLKQSRGTSPPPPVVRLLELRFRATAGRSLILAGELLKVREIFAHHGIRVLPWKGPALSAALYGSSCIRDSLDLDLLVDRSDIGRAAAALICSGYTLQKANQGLAASRAFRHLCFTAPGSQLLIELHCDIGPRRLLSPANGLSLGFEDLWRRRTTVSLLGVTIPHLGPEQLLLALCIHGAWHYWSRLIWVCDVALAVRRLPVDWHELIEAAARLRCRRRLYLGLILASDLLGADAPRECRDALAATDGVPAIAHQLEQTLIAGNRHDVVDWAEDLEDVGTAAAMMDGYLDRLPMWLNFVRAHIGPSASDRAYFALPRCLSAAYYLLRPMRLLRDYGCRAAFRLSRTLVVGPRGT